ncbi:hypothetical protein [Lysinibacillus contaminans]|nr:hypothetical protein [Lysinibacillus contaminans]
MYMTTPPFSVEIKTSACSGGQKTPKRDGYVPQAQKNGVWFLN